MSKFRASEITYDSDNFIVGTKEPEQELSEIIEEEIPEIEPEPEIDYRQEAIKESELILNRARDDAQNIVDKAKQEAQKILDEAKQEALDFKTKTIDEANTQAQNITQQAQEESNNLIESSKKETNELIENSKKEIEQQRIETINRAYNEGYSDGEKKIAEELEQKIKDFGDFCSCETELRNKVLKTLGKDVFNIINNISKKILLKELDGQIIQKIIDNTINLLEKKENITIILSEKYAKLLFELQNNTLSSEAQFDFSQFKQYKNFDVIYNPNFESDTIIIENLKERYDASITAQLDVIIRDILKNSNNGYLEIGQNLEKNESE